MRDFWTALVATFPILLVGALIVATAYFLWPGQRDDNGGDQ